ncbi:MAG: hypothetical protein LUP99_03745 [Methanomicrobiales archaeon]|nr:hypothetical protein [Methanomicrobiales archaeon]
MTPPLVTILLLVALLAGCAAPQQGSNMSPTMLPPTTLTTAPPQTSPSGSSSVPGPTQTMPADKSVTVDVVRDQIFPTITLTFRGGKGQFQVRDIDFRVTRSDGVIETKKLGHNVGDTPTFDGTRGKDRVEVTVTLVTNEQYKIIDALYDYYAHA